MRWKKKEDKNFSDDSITVLGLLYWLSGPILVFVWSMVEGYSVWKSLLWVLLAVFVLAVIIGVFPLHHFIEEKLSKTETGEKVMVVINFIIVFLIVAFFIWLL